MAIIDIHIHIHANDAKQEEILQRVKHIEENMVTQEQINELTAQVQKINAEIVASANILREQIRILQEQIDAGLNLDITALQQALQMLDDLNPDAA